MALSSPGGAKTGASGSGNAVQLARRHDHGESYGPENPSIPKSVTSSGTQVKASAPRGRQRTKTQIALSLLERSKGASIADMQNAMGWQAHSVRGFLAGTIRKMPGLTLVSDKTDTGPRRYHIQAAAQ